MNVPISITTYIIINEMEYRHFNFRFTASESVQKCYTSKSHIIILVMISTFIRYYGNKFALNTSDMFYLCFFFVEVA